VRELRNVIDRAVVVCRGDRITPEDLTERVRGGAPGPSANAPPPPSSTLPETDADFKDRVKQFETDLIIDALRKAQGNQTEAAKMLRMPLRTLVHKIKTLGIKKSFSSD
jgi:DNA-binding NtrC family response regulator